MHDRRTQAHVDSLVTTKGYEQNEMLRRRFKDIPIDAIYSSDSFRSIMTVDPIAKERNLPINIRILRGKSPQVCGKIVHGGT